jgi:hypothetical protein
MKILLVVAVTTALLWLFFGDKRAWKGLWQ